MSEPVKRKRPKRRPVPDFRLYADFIDHPKTGLLRDEFGSEGVERLIALWSWVATPANKRTRGDLSGMTDRQIEHAAGWRGERGLFARTIVALRWLDGEDGARKVHDWEEHQPWSLGAEARSQKASYAAFMRWCRKQGIDPADFEPEECSGHAPSMPQASPEHARAMPPTARRPDGPASLPSVEKREEEARPPDEGQAQLIDLDPEPGPDVATPERVFALYLAVMPAAGWVKHSKLTKGLRASIASRLRESAPRRAIGWWADFFARTAQRVTWPTVRGCATLEFVVRSEDQLVAFADGAKDDRGSGGSSGAASQVAPARDYRREVELQRQEELARSMVAVGLLGPEELDPFEKARDPPATKTLVLKSRSGGYVVRASREEIPS